VCVCVCVCVWCGVVCACERAYVCACIRACGYVHTLCAKLRTSWWVQVCLRPYTHAIECAYVGMRTLMCDCYTVLSASDTGTTHPIASDASAKPPAVTFTTTCSPVATTPALKPKLWPKPGRTMVASATVSLCGRAASTLRASASHPYGVSVRCAVFLARCDLTNGDEGTAAVVPAVEVWSVTTSGSKR
jgi:hypothetical protein